MKAVATIDDLLQAITNDTNDANDAIEPTEQPQFVELESPQSESEAEKVLSTTLRELIFAGTNFRG